MHIWEESQLRLMCFLDRPNHAESFTQVHVAEDFAGNKLAVKVGVSLVSDATSGLCVAGVGMCACNQNREDTD